MRDGSSEKADGGKKKRQLDKEINRDKLNSVRWVRGEEGVKGMDIAAKHELRGARKIVRDEKRKKKRWHDIISQTTE